MIFFQGYELWKFSRRVLKKKIYSIFVKFFWELIYFLKIKAKELKV